MVTSGNRRYANPIIVNTDGSTKKIRRVSFTENMFQENWLQNLIQENPELLPISEIEPAFSPAIPVGYEVESGSGPMDNLLLSPQGNLTIIETKLWRNPQARREVVGQIIDYAKDVSKWTFEELEEKVRSYNLKHRQSSLGILDSLRLIEDIEESEEHIIIDAITRNLQRGRFLLLVVGDGIRESVETMADFLQQTPQLHFTLALVELQVYELSTEDEKPLLVIPQIVARTREIIRAVVRVEGEAIESVQVGLDTEITEGRTTKPRYTLTKDDFFKLMKSNVSAEDVEFADNLIRDMQELGCVIDWKQGSFVVKLPDPSESGQKLSLLVVPTNGRTYLRAELGDQLRSLGLPEQISSDYARESSKLFDNCRESEKQPGDWSRPVNLSELREKYAEFMSIFQKTIDRIREASKA